MMDKKGKKLVPLFLWFYFNLWSFILVGGGFPGNGPTKISFDQIAAELGPTVDRLFPAHIRVIAEPGRYFVSSAYTLAVNVVARRVVARDASAAAKEEDGAMAVTTKDQHPSYMCKCHQFYWLQYSSFSYSYYFSFF